MASKRIKGFTIEIDGNTTGLSKALNKVDKNIKNTQSALKDVEKLLKLDPTNTELLAQKQRLLGEAISDTESRLETLKTASEKAAETKDNYDAWKEKYDPIQEQISKTSEELKKLKEQDEKAKDQLSKGEITQEQYNSIQKNVGETSDKLKALKQSAKDVSNEFGNPISSSQYDALQREIIETEQELQNLQREADNSKEALVKMSETGEKMQSVGDKISGVGESLMPVTNGIVSIGKAVVQTGADFDAEMSKVEAIAGTIADEDLPDLIETAEEMGLSFEEGATATETAMNIIRAKAREMGSQTKYSASEAGEAFEYMAMAGWKPYDMLTGVEGVLNLAAASGEELATTSDIVTDALTALGMGAKDAGHFSDVLAAASSNANTNVSMLGESFKYVAPIAGALGANAEDLALALGLMANSGIKGSQAGNALKNGLTNLTGVSKKYTKEMENLGLMTTETVNTIDQAEIDKAQAKVADKTADLEKKQIAYNQALETYSSDSPKVQNAMGNVETAQINLNDAISKYGEDSSEAQKEAIKLEQAQNNLNSVMSQCGEDSPKIQQALIDLETAERHLEEAQNDLATAQQGTWETVGTGKSLLVDEYGNMKSLGEIMDILREKMGGVDVAITDAEGNLRSYDDIIADLEQSEEGLTQAEQLKSAAVLFGKDNLSGMLAVINASEKDYNKLRDAIYGCEGTAETMAKTMQDNLEGQLTILKSQLEELAISFSDILMPTIRAIVSKIQEFADKLNSLSPEMKETIVKIALIVAAIAPALIAIGKVITTIGTILTIIPKIVNAIKLVKTAMIALNTTLLANPIFLIIAAVAALVAGFIYLWNNCEGFRNFWIGLWEEIQNTLYSFFEAWETGWNTIKEFFTNLWDGFIDSIILGWETIANAFSSAWEAIKTGWNNFIDSIILGWKTITNAFSSAWEAIKTGLNDFIDSIILGWETIANAFSSAWESIKNFFTTAWNNFQENFKTGIDSIKTFWTNAWTNIKDFFSNIWNTIKTTVKNIMNNMKNIISTIWNNVKSAVSEKITSIKDSIVNGLNSAVSFIKNLAGEAWSWGADIIDNIVNGIKNKINDVANVVSDVANTIWEFLHFSVPEKGPLTKFESWMPDFMNGLASGIKKNQKVVENAVNGVAEAMQLSMNNDLNYTISGTNAMISGSSAGTVNNYYNDNSQTFNQNNNSPKALSRWDIYRQTNNLLSRVKKAG